MKKVVTILFLLVPALYCQSQEEEQYSHLQELMLEQQLLRDETLQEDDGQWQENEYFRRRPLQLNLAAASDLQDLRLLSPWQIQNFLLYRQVFGKLLSVYELQAVPGWDEATIVSLLPYISIDASEATDQRFFKRFKNGESSFLLRSGKWLEKEGPSAFVRYRYKYERQLQWGITAEKDAGEPFFKGRQQYGFDFYSAHLFARRVGKLRVLALGDFQVNIGQGLIQWQGMSFSQGAVLSLKKHSEILQPYSSAGEFNFHRGAGITAGARAVRLTAFVSLRKLSARVSEDSTGKYFSGFATSGYHRTAAEQLTKQAVRLLTSGASLQFRKRVWQLGFNTVQYYLNIPMRKPQPLYRIFSIEGQQWFNASIDYSATIRNFHFFGEAAIDKRNAWAFTNGLLFNADPKFQMGLSYRNFSRQFQSLFSSAVSAGTAPSNEEGITVRMEWQPARRWKLQAMADLFRFPWLRYRVDAPSNGYEHLFSVVHQVSRSISLFCRYQISSKPVNQPDSLEIKFPAWQQRKQWRLQWSWQMNNRWKVTQRTDYLVAGNKQLQETGFSWWFDATCNPSRQWMFNARLHIYETGSYQSRIYSYERDLLYSYSMPAFSGNAIRAYLLTRYKFRRAIKPAGKGFSAECWLKFAFTLRPRGLDLAAEQNSGVGNRDLRLQFLFRR